MSAFLNQPVLVLNRLWQAVNVCSARRALTLLFEGRAQVVVESE
ncbi:MAG TPA: HNH endonuclease, partial [Verrucomicrobiota bacterium]|nr:HNH endonuclease [Verrucomicrobiota bacterium]